MIEPQELAKVASIVGTPFFLYDEATLVGNIDRILNAAQKHGLSGRISVFLAYFANSNPHLFKIVQERGLGIAVQGVEEWSQLERFRLTERIVVSPSFLSGNEIDFWGQKDVTINLASLEEVRYFVEKFRRSPSFRIDISEDRTQRTAIKPNEFDNLSEFLRSCKTPPRGIHVYPGTGSSLDTIERNFRDALCAYKQYFPGASEINLGGGFGFDYSASDTTEKHFNWDKFFHFVSRILQEEGIPESLRLIIEPGRDVLADTGLFTVLVKRVVTQEGLRSVAIDGSFVYMPSATTRKRQHQLNFFTHDWKPLLVTDQRAVLSGCTTLSSDYLFPGHVSIPEELQAGDYVVVHDIGAYGATQHLEFLNKAPCPEVLRRKDEQLVLITRKGEVDDRIRYLLEEPVRL